MNAFQEHSEKQTNKYRYKVTNPLDPLYQMGLNIHTVDELLEVQHI